MATQVYIIKRYLRDRRKNGQRKHRYVLRWEDPESGKFKCESTGTADRTAAEALQKIKWAEVNGLIESEPEAEPAAGKPSWKECRDAAERAMSADNLRPAYVLDAVQTFDRLAAVFPSLASPADLTPALAHEFKRLRHEKKVSPWTIKGDLATLKAVFGKWLMKECGLISSNPFAAVKAPRCDDPAVRIVSRDETKKLLAWLEARWNNWQLPLVYLEVAMTLGWRATELASIREEDILPDGFVRVPAETSKTRRVKHGWLPAELHAELRACAADGWAFGRFADELRRLLILWHRQRHHAACVKAFEPRRLVGWLQKELERFNDDQEALAAEETEKGNPQTWERFTLHDFRRTAITGLQMSGSSEKDVSVMVGATPEVIRKHYEKLNQMTIAKKNVERRLDNEGQASIRLLRAGCARPVDKGAETLQESLQVVTA